MGIGFLWLRRKDWQVWRGCHPLEMVQNLKPWSSSLCNIDKSVASRCSLGISRVAAAADRLAASATGGASASQQVIRPTFRKSESRAHNRRSLVQGPSRPKEKSSLPNGNEDFLASCADLDILGFWLKPSKFKSFWKIFHFLFHSIDVVVTIS